MFNTFKSVLLQANFYSDLTDDHLRSFVRNIYKLREDVRMSTTFSELIQPYIHYARNVMLTKEEKIPFDKGYYVDLANSCDGEDSPFSVLARCLLDTPDYLSEYLSYITSNQQLYYHQWILFEIQYACWFDPVRYYNSIEIYIKHPVVGHTFTIEMSKTQDDDFYLAKGYPLSSVYALMHRLIETYKECWNATGYTSCNVPYSPGWGQYVKCEWSDKLKYDFGLYISLRKQFVNADDLFRELFPTSLTKCTDCYICGESYTKVCKLICTHEIHDKCMKDWYSIQNTKRLPTSCPYCRCSLDNQ